MRWSRFKDKDSREIFLTMQQRVFPAIKKMKHGRLPDFDANGERVEIADDPTRPESWVPPLWALPVLPSPRWFPSF